MFFEKYFKINSISPLDIERQERIFYINYIQPGMVVFDVGANVGEISLIFSKFTGEKGEIHAFEPTKSVFAKLKTICDLTNKNNIKLNQVALSDEEGEQTFFQYEEEYASLNSLANRPLSNYGLNIEPISIEKVLTTTLDKYCELNKIPNIDLLKIDVEGAELQVMLGAQNMLKEKKIKCILFEFGQTTFDMGNKPEDILLYLKEMNYKVKNLIKGQPVFPGGSKVETAQFSIHLAYPI